MTSVASAHVSRKVSAAILCRWRPRIILCVVASILFGCGGSGDSGSRKVTLTGFVQKGEFSTLEVSAFIVDEATGELGEAIPAEIDQQSFSVNVDRNELILLEANGKFANEISGDTVVLDKPLKALFETESSDAEVNINIASHLSAARTLSQLSGGQSGSEQLIAENNGLFNEAFGFADDTDPTLLSFDNITETSDIADANLQLLLLSAVIVGSLDGDSLFADGFGFLEEAFVAAESVTDMQYVLEQYSGFGASSLYSEIVNSAASNPSSGTGAAKLSSGAGASGPLPVAVDLDESLVWDCTTLQQCTWVLQPAPTVSVAAKILYEADGEAHVAVRLGQISADPVIVRLFTTPNSATSNIDFVERDLTIQIPAGDTGATVDVTIIIDSLLEGDETFAVSLESQTAAYSVLAGEATITVRDGAPAGLEDQDATELKILYACLREISSPEDLNALDCTQVLNPIMPVGLSPSYVANVELDLAATCVAGDNCPPQFDWLVDFFLVAEDGMGIQQGEKPLGKYVYANESVQLENDPVLARSALISLGTEDIAGFMQVALINGWSLLLEARIDSQPILAKAIALPELVPIPDEIQAGNRVVRLGRILGVDFPGALNCAPNSYELRAEFIISTGADGVDSLAIGDICIETDVSNDGSITGVMTAGSVDLLNTIVDLPAGHTFVYVPAFAAAVAPPILPFGFAEVLPILGAIQADGSPATIRILLHAEGLPFMFRVEGGQMTVQGFEVAYDDMQYVMDVGYSAQDPRTSGKLFSNDIFYAGVSGHSGTIILGPNGELNTMINVSAGSQNTAFPKGQIQWEAFSQNVQNGVLADNAQTNFVFLLRQNTSCRTPGCADGTDLIYAVQANDALIDPSGNTIATAQEITAVTPGWGGDSIGNHAFRRPDDLAGIDKSMQVALPGYRFPDGTPVANFLMSHMYSDGMTVGHQLFPLGSIESIDGNFYPTGLTIGPETYRDEFGQPHGGGARFLAGNNLSINNGSDLLSLSSSVATKYVVRNAGITGVFNIEPAALAGEVSFYGYAFEFDRFAIRLVDNAVDKFTWIDGELVLHGEAGGAPGLDLFFSGLEMNCSARFGNASLLYENCDLLDNNGNGIIDENCDHRLFAWKADTEIFSMRFDTGASCAVGNQQLTLDQQVFFESINGPLGLEGTWNAAGDLVGQKLAMQDSYRLDHDEGISDGFPFRAELAGLVGECLTAGAPCPDEQRYGWAQFNSATIAVPFWKTLRSDIRIANKLSLQDPVAEPTVMVPNLQSLQNPNAPQTNGDLQQAIIDDSLLDMVAEYEWGSTGFGFSLPVYYSPAQFNGEFSQFFGRRQEKTDLFVLEAGAGIDFIQPDRTKLSFGASADFSRLKSLRFQIDLTNPDNLGKVDALLEDLGIIDGPMFAPALDNLQEQLFVLNRLANRGLDEVMTAALESSIEELGIAAAPLMPNGEDPFITASRSLAQIKSYPQQLFLILDEDIKGSINAALNAQKSDLQMQLVDLELQLSQVTIGAPAAVTLIDSLDQATALLDAMEQATIDAINGIDQSIDDVLNLVTQIQGAAIELRDAITAIDLVLLQAVTFAELACSNGDAQVGGYLDEIFIRLASVRQIFSLLEDNAFLLPLAGLLNNDPELRDRLEQTQRDLRDKAEELTGFLDAAGQAIQSQVCDERYDDLLAAAWGVLLDMKTDLGKIEGAIPAVLNTVQSLSAIPDGISLIVIRPLQQTSAVLLTLRGNLSGLSGVSGAILIANLDTQLSVATSGLITALVANNATERDVIGYVFDVAQTIVNSSFDNVRTQLQTEVNDRLPGAFYSPDQLRRMLVALIMDSTPIQDLRVLMNDQFSEINYRVNNLVLILTDQLNLGIRAALQGVESEINDALDVASAPIRNIPLQSAGLDGFAIIAGNELERVHIAAEWTMSPSAEGQEANTYGAAFDAVSWSVTNKAAGCGVGVDSPSSRLDVTISAFGLPASLAGSDILLKKLYLGFTLAQGSGNFRLEPRGVFGGISTTGDISFSEAIIYDPAFVAGIGDIETYIGASAGALFSDIQAEVAFLVGRTCDADILTTLDPRIGEFITLPPSGFGGVYMRGGASIPVLTLGCPLTVGVGADFGAWVLAGPPATIGGLIGGSVYGKVACIGSLRGQLLAVGQVNTDGELFFKGQGFGAAGLGWCEPATWTTRARSREDDYCGTVDALFEATFDNGKWSLPSPELDGIF